MNRSMVLDYGLLERLTQDAEIENIIIGTGTLARDMQEKLLLLGLKVPFLVGEKDDESNAVLHYDRIAGLDNPKQYRFIICCDIDEWTLIGHSQMAAYKLLGNAVHNHPKVIRFTSNAVLFERAGKVVIDAVNGDTLLHYGLPYAVFGNISDQGAFHIHIMGNCQAGGMWSTEPPTFPEALQQKLKLSGLSSVIYTWGQPHNPTAESITHFIRDICFHKVDLLIHYNNVALDPLAYIEKNVLSASVDSSRHMFYRTLEHVHNEAVSNGIDHDCSLLNIAIIQQRIFNAFSRLFGFTFWNIIPPNATLLNEEQARALRGFSSGYLARRRKRHEEFLSVLDKQITKDYTDIFAQIEDIYTMYGDARHLSSAGNRLVAGRCAADIMEVFGNYRNNNRED